MKYGQYLLRFAILLFVCYLVAITGIVIWLFEFRLQRHSTFVYASPYALHVGDDIIESKLLERLTRLGYTESASPVPEPGSWNRSGSGINLFLKHCPFSTEAIVSGPVSINLDWNRIKTIRLMRSQEEVSKLILEPELLQLVPATAGQPELSRYVKLDRIPDLLISAILLTEDTHFFSHQGIDFNSTYEALKSNIKAGRYVQGGSTISQQLIRMTLLSPEKTLIRKINEIFLAIVADAFYSKRTILEAYLNKVYLGQCGQYPVRGVSEAARNFFGKSLSGLDASECALLAASIRAPNVINPLRRPDRAKARRNMVLGLLLKAGRIDREVYEQAIETPVLMLKHSPSYARVNSFLELIKDQLPVTSVSDPDVITTLDPVSQNQFESFLKKFDDAGTPYYFLQINPENGYVKSYVTHVGATKWRGTEVSSEIAHPFVLIPAFITDKVDRAKFTLAGHVGPATSLPGAPIQTVRQVFRSDRPALVGNVVSRVNPEVTVQTAREFGFDMSAKQNFSIKPVSPLEVASAYSILASVGRIKPLRFFGDIDPESSTEESRKVALKPAALFLVNFLLKGLSDTELQGIPQEMTLGIPSVFKMSSSEDSWLIAYRSDNLMVLRIKTSNLPNNTVRKFLSFFKTYNTENVRKLEIPEGIVFRKICRESGARAVSICPEVIAEPFIKGTQPEVWCTSRHNTEIPVPVKRPTTPSQVRSQGAKKN